MPVNVEMLCEYLLILNNFINYRFVTRKDSIYRSRPGLRSISDHRVRLSRMVGNQCNVLTRIAVHNSECLCVMQPVFGLFLKFLDMVYW